MNHSLIYATIIYMKKIANNAFIKQFKTNSKGIGLLDFGFTVFVISLGILALITWIGKRCI